MILFERFNHYRKKIEKSKNQEDTVITPLQAQIGIVTLKQFLKNHNASEKEFKELEELQSFVEMHSK